MGKIKKFKEEFKEQNLLTKFRIIIISILYTIVVVEARIAQRELLERFSQPVAIR